jgi:hypothetical protein
MFWASIRNSNDSSNKHLPLTTITHLNSNYLAITTTSLFNPNTYALQLLLLCSTTIICCDEINTKILVLSPTSIHLSQYFNFYLCDIENNDINYKEMFVDTKGVIRNRKAKTEKQCNGQKKRDKRTMIYKHNTQLGYYCCCVLLQSYVATKLTPRS